jgi:CheY-like chemotaxis protein
METILVVEDEEDLRTLLVHKLVSEGYQVHEAADGEEGLRKAKEVSPDLIVSDVLMPKMDGHQFLKRLRESEFGRDIPFIILTARRKMQDFFETMEIDDFLAKPFESRELLIRIRRVLTKGRLPYPPPPPADPDGEDPSTSHRKKVLIIDDDTIAGAQLRVLLIREDYAAINVKNVSQGLEKALLTKPDLIILKFFSGGIGCVNFIALIKKMEHLQDIPVLVYSYTPVEESERSLLTAGASGFLPEITRETLMKEVAKFLDACRDPK